MKNTSISTILNNSKLQSIVYYIKIVLTLILTEEINENIIFNNQYIAVAQQKNNSKNQIMTLFNIKLRTHFIVILIITSVTQSKILDRYDLAKVFYDNGLTDITQWICMTGELSAYNTSKLMIEKVNSGHGLFLMYYPYWCGIQGNGGKCDINCNKFRNDDLSDDIECVKVILDMQGIQAWQEAYNICKSNKNNDVPDWVWARNTDIDAEKPCPPRRNHGK